MKLWLRQKTTLCWVWMEMTWKSVENWTDEGLLQLDQEHVAEEDKTEKTVGEEKD